MKIISIERQLGASLSEPLSATFIPDSALVAAGRPLFVPEFSTRWVGCLYLAARIGRLGKNIPARFASRYCDALGLALRLIPLDLMEELRSTGRGSAVATGFDNAISLNLSLPYDPLNDTYRIDCGDFSREYSAVDSGITESIVALSRYMTLKTGDVILTGRLPVEVPIEIDTIVEAILNGVQQLKVRLK